MGVGRLSLCSCERVSGPSLAAATAAQRRHAGGARTVRSLAVACGRRLREWAASEAQPPVSCCPERAETVMRTRRQCGTGVATPRRAAQKERKHNPAVTAAKRTHTRTHTRAESRAQRLGSSAAAGAAQVGGGGPARTHRHLSAAHLRRGKPRWLESRASSEPRAPLADRRLQATGQAAASPVSSDTQAPTEAQATPWRLQHTLRLESRAPSRAAVTGGESVL